MHNSIAMGFLISFPVRTTYVRVPEGMLFDYELVIYTLLCVLSYMMCYLSCVFTSNLSCPCLIDVKVVQ